MIQALSSGILGVVEGVTEFLPISSTGHLIVASRLLNFQDSGGSFEIVIQLGAILAVVWYYRHELLRQARAVKTDAGVQSLWKNIVISFIPAALLGVLFHKQIKAALFTPTVVAVSLILGGIALWAVEKLPHKATHSVEKITPKEAFMVGCMQILALVPGVSRSGATIVGGLLGGMDRSTATTFSFYLAIPTLGAATLFDLAGNFKTILHSGMMSSLVIGTVVSFFVALAAISWLLKFVSSHDFRRFALYRILVGVAILAWFR